jgi:DNA-binding NtrC family response regulator
MLRAHDWPGNIRELKNAVLRLLLFPESGPSGFREGHAVESQSQSAVSTHLPLREAREQVIDAFERAYILAKLTECGGNVSRAADAMGVSRQFLHRLMDRHDVRRTDLK